MQLICAFVFVTDRTSPLLPKSEISGLWPSSTTVQPSLCQTQTWSETMKTCFLMTLLTFKMPSAGSRLSESCLFLVPLTSAGSTLRYVRSKSSGWKSSKEIIHEIFHFYVSAVGRVPYSLIARSRGRISPGVRCCALEQDTISSLLSTGSTQETVLT